MAASPHLAQRINDAGGEGAVVRIVLAAKVIPLAPVPVHRAVVPAALPGVDGALRVHPDEAMLVHALPGP